MVFDDFLNYLNKTKMIEIEYFVEIILCVTPGVGTVNSCVIQSSIETELLEPNPNQYFAHDKCSYRPPYI